MDAGNNTADGPAVVAVPESAGNNTSLPQPPMEQQVVGTGMLYTELWPEYCNPSYRMPPVIEVKVALEQGDYVFPVIVEKAEPSSKKYLGGFRNKITGHLYHHAVSQTPVVKKELKDTSMLRTRETQTSELRTLSTQSYREYGTQMERIDVHLDTRHDRIKSVRSYVTAAEVNKLKLLNTIKIQRFWRGYVARCLAHTLRRRNQELDERDRRDRERAEEDAKQRAALEVSRRAHPKNASDFAVLYNELDTWRNAELAKIKVRVCVYSSFVVSSDFRSGFVSPVLGADRGRKGQGHVGPPGERDQGVAEHPAAQVRGATHDARREGTPHA